MCKPLLGLWLVLLAPISLHAQFDYTNNPDGSVTITEYTGSGGEVIIPGTLAALPVTVIGTNAFQNCTLLESLIIPSSLKSIEAEAFYNCDNLTNVTIADGLTNIGVAAFYGCDYLGAITIPASVATIGAEAFYLCNGITNAVISDGVRNIGDEAFFDCADLIGITIPASVTNIGEAVFAQCFDLTEIAVNASNPDYSSFHNVLFNKTHTDLIAYPPGIIGSYAIPTGVTNIEPGAFEGSISLTTVSIPATVTNISSYAFAYCYNMTAATLPNTVTNFADHAFYGCNELVNLPMPANLVSIGAEAFYGCYAASYVTIPFGVTNIGTGAFEWCASLQLVSLQGENPFYSVVDNVLFNENQTTLIEFPGGIGGSYAIPSSVTSIGPSAFEGCQRLTGVTIPDGVASIGDYAFAYCYGLASAIVPNSVTNIGNYTFYGCNDITNAIISDSVASLGNDVFYGCYGLTHILVPSTVTNLGEDAFAWCIHLTNICFEGEPPAADPTAFYHDVGPPIAYYLPGASGWSANFDGLPTLLWNPVIQTAAASGFGVQSNQFGFNIVGTPNIPVVVQASASLSDPNWTFLQSITLTSGSFYFADTNSASLSARFYRISLP